jgi:hypothetical protein
MLVQPAVEVNSVVHQPPSQADRRWTNAGEQGPADTEITSRLLAREAARHHGGNGV